MYKAFLWISSVNTKIQRSVTAPPSSYKNGRIWTGWSSHAFLVAHDVLGLTELVFQDCDIKQYLRVILWDFLQEMEKSLTIALGLLLLVGFVSCQAGKYIVYFLSSHWIILNSIEVWPYTTVTMMWNATFSWFLRKRGYWSFEIIWNVGPDWLQLDNLL